MGTWYRQKTTWACIAGIVTAVGAAFTGDMSIAEAILLGLGSVRCLFLRQGVAKVK